ncbi:MAG: acyltransferase [Rhodospirillales bacterium]|nr:acyltransferase [Rhodospirillales bacterium]
MAFLDGLRGIAAMQVVLLHYTSAFLPVMAMAGTVPWYPAAMPGWPAAVARSPLIFLINGYSAVYIFFLMSGYVLRGGFARVDRFAIGIGRRLIRLGLPTAAAVMLAGALLALDQSAHRTAGMLSGSTQWLAVLMAQTPHLGEVLREAWLNSVVTGYRETTALPPLRHVFALPSVLGAFDTPTWTLNVELAGSLLCLGLSFIERRSKKLLLVATLALAAVYGADQLFLFVIGYLLAGLPPRTPGRLAYERVAQGAAVCALVTGILLCRLTAPAPVLWLRIVLHFQHPPDPFHFTNQIGAVLIFLGVLNLPAIQRSLTTRVPHFLGRISFPLYLLHFPIMATLGCSVFIAVQPALGNVVGGGVALAVGLAVTLPAAWVFERWVDRTAVRLSHGTPVLAAAPATP